MQIFAGRSTFLIPNSTRNIRKLKLIECVFLEEGLRALLDSLPFLTSLTIESDKINMCFRSWASKVGEILAKYTPGLRALCIAVTFPCDDMTTWQGLLGDLSSLTVLRSLKISIDVITTRLETSDASAIQALTGTLPVSLRVLNLVGTLKHSHHRDLSRYWKLYTIEEEIDICHSIQDELVAVMSHHSFANLDVIIIGVQGLPEDFYCVPDRWTAQILPKHSVLLGHEHVHDEDCTYYRRLFSTQA